MSYLNQSKFIGIIFKQFGLVESKPIQIPFMTNYKLSKDMGLQNDADLEIMWVIPFQNVIGSFMYAMVCKRFDIGHVVGFVS
jgi:hypothetical protein